MESGEEVFGVGGYLGSHCVLTLLTNADLKPDISSAHNPLSSFHTLDVDLNIHLGAKGSSGTNWKDSIRGSIPSVMNVNLVRK